MAKIITKKVNKRLRETIAVDFDSGEVKDAYNEVKEDIIQFVEQEEFFITYTTLIGALNKLTKMEEKVLRYACVYCAANINEIAFVKAKKDEISKQLGCKSPQAIANAVSGLKKKNILIPIGSGIYLINPKYFWKGNTEKRLNALKYYLTLTYGDDTKFEKLEIPEEK